MHWHESHKQAPYKRIILCADGTWMSSNLGESSIPSNVAKIARAIAPTGIDEEGRTVKQIVFYHSGIGTGDLPFQAAIYGGLGWSLGHHVCQIYDFLANNYEQGDEIFMFGFSRGAYTVRSLAGLVCDVGVLNATDMRHFPELWKAYQANTNGAPFMDSAFYQDHQDAYGLGGVKIKVVGVWETVGALGLPGWPIVGWLAKHALSVNKSFDYLNTKLSDKIENAFQALGLDEKRLTFPPSVWHKPHDNKTSRLEQCWFPGVHSNIGGQAEFLESWGDRQEIGDNTFAWMVDNCSQMLTFEESAIQQLIEAHKAALDRIVSSGGWGCGRIHDNFSFPDGTFFWLLGKKVRTPGDYARDSIDNSIGPTNEFFHPIVRRRKERLSSWKAPSMKGFQEVDPDLTKQDGFTWRKDRIFPNLKEYVMLREKRMSISRKVKNKDGSKLVFGTEDSLSRRLCPPEVLRELDNANQSAMNVLRNGHKKVFE